MTLNEEDSIQKMSTPVIAGKAIKARAETVMVGVMVIVIALNVMSVVENMNQLVGFLFCWNSNSCN